MSKKKKYSIISIPLNDHQRLVQMGNKVRDGFAKIKYFASDLLYYEEFEEPIFIKKP